MPDGCVVPEAAPGHLDSAARDGAEGPLAGPGYLGGSFDLLNVAHLDVIKQARARCSRLVVGVFSDQQVGDLTGRPPVVPLEERVALVRHVRGVDEALVHDPDRPVAGGPYAAFAFDDDSSPEASDATRLEPRSQTSSPVLRAALAPAVSRAEAG